MCVCVCVCVRERERERERETKRDGGETLRRCIHGVCARVYGGKRGTVPCFSCMCSAQTDDKRMSGFEEGQREKKKPCWRKLVAVLNLSLWEQQTVGL